MTEIQANKKVLMIAFHFPPNSSIGAQRTFKTAEYLPEFGWEPIVLTAKASAYDAIEQTQQIPQPLLDSTYRTTAFDVHRHLTIMGKHLGWMAMIDRWTTWIPGAVWKGMKIIKQNKPDLIWSTSPIPSAHIIARILSKKYNIPWVADYRDPFHYHHTSTSSMKNRALKAIDKMTIKNASAAVFTTPKTTALYQDYFNDEPDDKFFTVENGYDEQNWGKLVSHTPTSINPMSKTKFSLLYSGVLYQDGRDPTPLFEAIKSLMAAEVINGDNFELIFQGSGDGDNYKDLINTMAISDLITFTPSVPYLDSLVYIGKADALVIIQDEVFNFQIPAKLYEYIRTSRPILVMTPENSSTAWAAKRCTLCAITKTSDKIATQLSVWIKNPTVAPDGTIFIQFSRHAKAAEMAEIFEQAINKGDAVG
jgi:hypothetical protein